MRSVGRGIGRGVRAAGGFVGDMLTRRSSVDSSSVYGAQREGGEETQVPSLYEALERVPHKPLRRNLNDEMGGMR